MTGEDFKQNDSIELVVEEGIDSALKRLHTCLPGVVDSFDPATQLADIQPTIKRKTEEEVVNLPLLTNVPVRFQKSADFSITFPITTGDEVLVIFAERSIDTWLEYGGIQNPFDFRKHDLSDAFAFPMMYSQKDVIPNFNASNLEIRLNVGTGSIVITPAGVVSIEGNASLNLDATEIALNSGADFAVKFTVLKGLIDSFMATLNTEFGRIQAGTLPNPVNPYAPIPQILDITTSQVLTVKLP